MKPSQLFRRLPVLVKPLVGGELDAIQLLERDHMKVESLYMAYKMTQDPKRKTEFISKIKEEVELHARIEEKAFYPVCAKNEELSLHVKEALEEHKQIKTLLEELSDRTVASETQQAKIKVLMENINHHVEEEETTFFPKVRQELSPRQISIITREILSMKKKSEPKSESVSESRTASVKSSPKKKAARRKAA